MRFRNRHRLLLLWLGFFLSVLAAALATYRLYRMAEREIVTQSDQALAQARKEALSSIHGAVEPLRHATIRELASFHIDGLRQMMQRWDDENDAVVGTFLWDQKSGFRPGPGQVKLPMGEKALAGLWDTFRSWRRDHPSANTCPLEMVGPFRVFIYPTRSNPDFPEGDLGYQSENLDILSHAGRPTDPWAGWAAPDNDPEAPWIFWYQGGPDDSIRGCLVDVRAVLKQMRSNVADTQYAHCQIVAASPGDFSAGVERLPDLPAYRLSLSQGDLFQTKSTDTRLTAVVAGTLFGIFILGGIGLALYTRRETRDAERKTNFVAQVSHELRTPLTSIRMYADLLAQPDITEAKRLKFSGNIARESARLGAMVERLLAFNAVERNSTKILKTQVDIASAVNEAVEETAGKLKAAGLVVEVRLGREPLVAQTDFSILKQALLNLLENAAKYAGGSGVVVVSASRSGQQLTIDVVDAGPGIPRSIRSRLFEPFVQGNRDLTNKSPGVGLGLSLARDTLRLVGGDLVLLETKTGAAFQIQLPSPSEPPSATS